MATNKIDGLDKVLNKMKLLSKEVNKKAVRRAAVRAMRIVRDAARANAMAIDDPNTANNIAKNIVIRSGKRRMLLAEGATTNDVGVSVGVLGGARRYGNTKENRRKGRVGKQYKVGGDKTNPGGDTYYWRYLEFGTKDIKATPFMRPAFSSNIENVTNSFVQEISKEIDKLVK